MYEAAGVHVYSLALELLRQLPADSPMHRTVSTRSGPAFVVPGAIISPR